MELCENSQRLHSGLQFLGDSLGDLSVVLGGLMEAAAKTSHDLPQTSLAEPHAAI